MESLSYSLEIGKIHSAEDSGREGWMIVPVPGGKLVVSVRGKAPMVVDLHPQEIMLRRVIRPNARGDLFRAWEIVEWHDYPNGDGRGPVGLELSK